MTNLYLNFQSEILLNSEFYEFFKNNNNNNNNRLQQVPQNFVDDVGEHIWKHTNISISTKQG